MTIEEIITEDNREGRNLKYGIYDVSNIEVLFIEDIECFSFKYGNLKHGLTPELTKRIVEFCNKHPNWKLAEAYQVYGIYLLSDTPPKFTGKRTGYFGRGANALLEDCPSKMLLLAEDD